VVLELVAVAVRVIGAEQHALGAKGVARAAAERETRLELATSSLEVTRWYLNSEWSKTPVGASDSAFWQSRGISTGAAIARMYRGIKLSVVASPQSSFLLCREPNPETTAPEATPEKGARRRGPSLSRVLSSADCDRSGAPLHAERRRGYQLPARQQRHLRSAVPQDHRVARISRDRRQLPLQGSPGLRVRTAE
jgi:hypothetical protein